ncbi:MaoC family dehydratase N-terminal domain-containing protein [Alloalcanivorax sp. C16-2]|uniref:FAS1-like dehydratase domain-containing protein n=1 Tax=Alloalcanivorax sp. C16-2 TaxID=3390052 RepID=UPI0039705373
MAAGQPQTWLGAEQNQTDTLDLGAVARVAATLGRDTPDKGDALPWLWHWAFFQAAAPAATLSNDGHPEGGGFLPPMPGLQRMWAGSRLTFQRPLRVGFPARRHSRVRDIQRKTGRNAGTMTFVTLDHHYEQDGEETLREQQDLVYREPRPLPARPGIPLPELHWRRDIKPDPVLLFRYSAVTFNSHRIHYDWPYATGAEGYTGLVVHGPLIATLVLDAFLDAHPGVTPTGFQFRGLRPLICPGQFVVGGIREEPGQARLFAGDRDGQSQTAEVHFKETP